MVDSNKVVTDFFNQLHNPQKVNRSVLVDSDVRIVEVDGKDVIYINVPRQIIGKSQYTSIRSWSKAPIKEDTRETDK